MSSEKEKRTGPYLLWERIALRERGGREVYGIKREGNSGHPLERRGDEKGVPLVRKGEGGGWGLKDTIKKDAGIPWERRKGFGEGNTS
jgi:hypothetical protein